MRVEAIEPVMRHKGALLALALHGGLIATGCKDRTVKLWDIETLQEQLSLPLGKFEPLCLDFSPDGLSFIVGLGDDTASIFDVVTGQKLRTLSGHQGYVLAVAWSHEMIATGSADKTVRLWRLDALPEPEPEPEAPPAPAMAPAAAAASTIVVSPLAPAPSAVAAAGPPITAAIAAVTVPALAPRPPTPSTLASDENASTLDQQEEPSTSTHGVDLDELEEVAFLPGVPTAHNNELPLLGGSGGEGPRGHVLARVGVLEGHQGPVLACAYSPNGQLFASSSRDKHALLWAVGDAEPELRHSLSGHAGSVQAVCFSGDSSRVVTGGADGAIVLWRCVDGHRLFTLKGHNEDVFALSWSPAPGVELLASGSQDARVIIWSVDTRRALHKITGHTMYIRDLAWSPDGKFLASASSDNSVKVWDAMAGFEAHPVFHEHGPHSVLCLAWAPRGRERILSGARDGRGLIWEPRRGNVLRVLSGHTTEIWGVAWAPDGSLCATASWDSTLRVWNPDKGEALVAVRAHASGIRACAWLRNARKEGEASIATAGYDKVVRLWAFEAPRADSTSTSTSAADQAEASPSSRAGNDAEGGGAASNGGSEPRARGALRQPRTSSDLRSPSNVLVARWYAAELSLMTKRIKKAHILARSARKAMAASDANGEDGVGGRGGGGCGGRGGADGTDLNDILTSFCDMLFDELAANADGKTLMSQEQQADNFLAERGRLTHSKQRLVDGLHELAAVLHSAGALEATPAVAETAGAVEDLARAIAVDNSL